MYLSAVFQSESSMQREIPSRLQMSPGYSNYTSRYGYTCQDCEEAEGERRWEGEP